MSFLAFSLLVFISHLSPADANQCGHLEIQHCTIDREWGLPRTGYVCETTKNGTDCLEAKNWCYKFEDFTTGFHCKDYSNLIFLSCLTITKTFEGHEYLISFAKTNWLLAEQFCQDRGYHLASFSSQEEYDAVVKFLFDIRNDSTRHNLVVTAEIKDPVAQRCFDKHKVDMHQGYMNQYWTGLFFDMNQQKWRNTDGSEKVLGIKSKHEPMSTAIDAAREGDTALTFMDRNFEFPIESSAGGHLTDIGNKGRIVCKKPATTTPWKSGPPKDNFGCTTGFKCTDQKCIVGPQFANTAVCNGVYDCDDNKDEDIAGICKTFVTPFPDGARQAHFLPMKRPLKTVRRFCELHNFHLPSVQSEGDITFLLSLPTKYAKNAENENDFNLILHDWNSLKMEVLLGGTRDSGNWDDGSAFGAFETEISNLKSNDDLLLSSQRFRANFKNNSDDITAEVFVVCQQNTPTTKPSSHPYEPTGLGSRLHAPALILLVGSPVCAAFL